MDKKIIKVDNINPNLRIINLYQCVAGFYSGARKLYDHYFLYVHSGKGDIVIDNKVYSALPGDLYFCPPGVKNTIIADNEHPFLLSGINFDFTDSHRDNELLYSINANNFNHKLITESIIFEDFEGFQERLAVPEDKGLQELIYKMVELFNSRKLYWQMQVNGLFQMFLFSVMQRTIQKKSGLNNTCRNDKIIEYLLKNYNTTNLKNCDVAKTFNYHSDYINKIVLKYTGMTIKQYITELRIREAIHLLQNSDISIKCIANKVGYENVYYFSKVFKQKTGLTPGYYRRDYVVGQLSRQKL